MGSYVIFGSFEQDNNIENGKEDIRWLVLIKESGRILVVSKYALDCQQNVGDGWNTCSLRSWLNKSFLNDAFSESEKANILNTSTDQVFLLSADEAENYFSSNSARQCQGTEYCRAQNETNNRPLHAQRSVVIYTLTVNTRPGNGIPSGGGTCGICHPAWKRGYARGRSCCA